MADERITTVCPACQGRFEMKLMGRYWEGRCVCGERWQTPAFTPVRKGAGKSMAETEREKATQELIKELDRLYIQYYAQGKEPGLSDARNVWQSIMRKFEAVRNSK